MTIKKKVTWKVDRKAHVELRPRAWVADVPLDDRNRELLEGKLVPGNLFVLRSVLEIDRNDKVKPSPYPYLYPGWYADRGFNVYTLAIYAGTVRVEELKKGTLFRSPRHSFIIDGCRYLVTNLNMFEPVV